jgi:agmatinase
MLLNHPALLFLLPAFAIAHSNHHTHHGDEEAFSVEALEELERKWGTDV